ncbi:MAG TPA: right-handed parallel beta-helix repeat-containing protein [Bryobacteraceae bacterium]|jgi:hypothetical protein|nr:right-handed parallel beta-helix repeat-containing protein [Bryobacteraceae bacterium]
MTKLGTGVILGSLLSISAICQSNPDVRPDSNPERTRVVNVHCDNVAAHDTAALNNSISRSLVGDYINIHGQCLVNETIVLFGDRTYAGDSRTGTVIKQAPGANLAALLASDSWNMDSSTTGDPIRIAHLTLDGNASQNIGTNVLVIRSWLTTIEDIEVQNAPQDGIRFTNPSKSGTLLTNTQVNSHLSNCFVTDSGANGIHVVDPGNSITDSDIIDCWIANSGQSAINMDNAAGWKIRGNHLYGIQQNAIYANRCFSTSIDENIIEDFGHSGGGTWYGIACTLQGDIASVISGNKVFMLNSEPAAGRFVYIGIPQVNYDVGEVAVTGNVILGSGSSRDTGLSYQLGNGKGLKAVSASNNVQGVAIPRSVGQGVMLVNGW